MKVLVIGSGGREHALVWSLRRSSQVKTIFTNSVNAGIRALAEPAECGPSLDAIVDFAIRERIDLTVVGPEQPLVEGITDKLSGAGLPVFGPCASAARLEGSKIFAKEFMKRHGVPTGRFEVAETAADALALIERATFGFPLVIKADGLAAGKGVIIAQDRAEAEAAVEELMVRKTLGDAGSRLLFEECLIGRELSYLVISDGQSYSALPVAQDHKRAFDGDLGPNTGGMGAFSVNGLLEPALEKRIRLEIVEPSLEGARREGFPFRGVLYCGLMLTDDGPKALEYNVRFGDPETQAILRRLDSDLADLFLAAAAGNIKAINPKWSELASACIVLASPGYPSAYPVGAVIDGLEAADQFESVVTFHAGTKWLDGKVVTNGGRVLGVTALGQTLEQAIGRAYEAVGQISFSGMQYRRDIGKK